MANGLRSSDSPPKIPVRLTERERSLLLEHELIPDALKVPLRFALVTGRDYEVRYTLAELARMAGISGAEASEGSGGKTAREWDSIARKMAEAGNEYVESLPPGVVPEGLSDEDLEAEAETVAKEFLESLPAEVAEEVMGILEREEFDSFDAFEERVMGVVEAFNERPYDGYGGLTPYQMDRLMNSDWWEAGEGMWVDDSFGFKDVAGSRVFHNARVLLGALEESDGTKATGKGNLSRAFVGEMLDRMAFPEGYKEEVRKVNKVVNEWDVAPLGLLREVLREAGFLRKYKGKIVTTKNGKECLGEDDDAARLLYLNLFFVFFRRIDLSCVDGFEGLDEIQTTLPYILYRLREAGKEWRTAEDLAEDVLLEPLKEEILETVSMGTADWPLNMRILDQLVEFGLLESRTVPREGRGRGEKQYRKTGWYDRFLRFDVGGVR